jgi:arabinose-5-phosphate isomerase
VESLHGDLGMIARDDIAVALSYSGETEETTRLLPLLAREGLKIVSLTNNPGSKLARVSDIVLKLNVRREACPYNVVPTSSTAAMLAVGDAIAVTLMRIKGFDSSSFARLHPGGNLGKLLNLRVEDLMHKGAANPVVKTGSTVRAALAVMTRTRAGATSVVDARGRLKGFFTDGDLRRYLQSRNAVRRAGRAAGHKPGMIYGADLEVKIETVMTSKPVCVTPDTMAIDAAKIISSRKIDNLPVIARATSRPIGILDEKDLLKEGLI